MSLKPKGPLDPNSPTLDELKPSFPKHCNCCGKDWDADQWKALPRVGTIEDPYEILELRNCTCDSTLTIILVSKERN